METTLGPVRLDIHVTVELKPGSEDQLQLVSDARIEVDGKPIGMVNRLRVDMISNETLPAIEIDMLKGVVLDDLNAVARANAEEMFDALRRCPGVKARMPAPRD